MEVFIKKEEPALFGKGNSATLRHQIHPRLFRPRYFKFNNDNTFFFNFHSTVILLLNKVTNLSHILLSTNKISRPDSIKSKNIHKKLRNRGKIILVYLIIFQYFLVAS